ncbi:hypothetical protein BDC45DRAFT_542794 [Circinella umbellata]|nr:hypothetical protein BDC45DRAFT_542794 [Circinella umbellata]
MVSNKHSIFFFTTILVSLVLTIMSSSSSAAPIVERRGISSYYKKGSSKLTMYWIFKKGDKDMTNDDKSVTLSGPKNKSLKTSNDKSIAKASGITYDVRKFQMKGIKLLRIRVIVNLGEASTDNGNAFEPYVSVASNDLKRGTKLYIKELGGSSGRVRVNDKGWTLPT